MNRIGVLSDLATRCKQASAVTGAPKARSVTARTRGMSFARAPALTATPVRDNPMNHGGEKYRSSSTEVASGASSEAPAAAPLRERRQLQMLVPPVVAAERLRGTG